MGGGGILGRERVGCGGTERGGGRGSDTGKGERGVETDRERREVITWRLHISFIATPHVAVNNDLYLLQGQCSNYLFIFKKKRKKYKENHHHLLCTVTLWHPCDLKIVSRSPRGKWYKNMASVGGHHIGKVTKFQSNSQQTKRAHCWGFVKGGSNRWPDTN